MGILTATLLGFLVGSFASVVVDRLPRGVSVLLPRSSCANCHRTLSVLDLVPILSFVALRGRCRTCKARLPIRDPALEILTAVGWAGFAWLIPPLEQPLAFTIAASWWTLLLIIAFIDVAHLEIPDVLTLPAVTLLAVLLALASPTTDLLPSAPEGIIGALVGAGILVLINRVGGLVMRRMRDTAERLWPVGFDTVNLAALAGAIGGARIGLGIAVVALIANLISRRTFRIPEPPLYTLWLAALMAAPIGVGWYRAAAGSLVAAGAAALIGAAFWWWNERRSASIHEERTLHDSLSTPPAEDEPVAMGFGDVKLAALVGVMLGWERLLVGLFVAVALGAVTGLLFRLTRSVRVLPFGPFLATGAVVSLLLGDTLLAVYLQLLGPN